MTFARGGGGGARGAWRASGEQHLPALRVIVAVGGGAQLRQLSLSLPLLGGRREAEEAARVGAHADDVAVADDALRVDGRRGAAVRRLGPVQLEAERLHRQPVGDRSEIEARSERSHTGVL